MEIDLGYIQRLAENHEGVDIEFKESTGQLDRGIETLCGMPHERYSRMMMRRGGLVFKRTDLLGQKNGTINEPIKSLTEVENIVLSIIKRNL